ncbi:ATP-binding protein [Leptolyngbya ectocarpi]|nr:ATP-binding protein [Leptolyngbya ectocarpi]
MVPLPPKFFNTAGPCDPEIHYMLPATGRLPQLKKLIAQRSYFVIHAPRQTGKTTAMLALAKELTSSGQHAAVLVSVESGVALGDDIHAVERSILQAWREDAEDQLPEELWPPAWPEAEPGQAIRSALRAWVKACPYPLALFIDEIDALQDRALISILPQLRAGYTARPKAFPHTVALIGLRDVRDYKLASGGSNRLQTASPFNIKVESLTLRNFTRSEIVTLYAQHTAATGQAFSPEALDQVYELTQGQPWLVNALARQLVEVIAPDPTEGITLELVSQAKERLIQRRDTHIDSLAQRLQEPRVKAILEPMLAGQPLGNVPPDDIDFVLDLGLCRLDDTNSLVIANPIYREVMPRMLAFSTSVSLNFLQPTWLTDDGHLDTGKLVTAFLDFWRQHGQPLLQNVSYHEIAPHIVMMAFLHRVVNGGGTLEREYAIGVDRMDLCLRYQDVVLGIELKVWRQGRPDPLAAGLEQLDGYLSGLGQATGWLVIFDQRENQPPIADRVATEQVESPQGREITLIRG